MDKLICIVFIIGIYNVLLYANFIINYLQEKYPCHNKLQKQCFDWFQKALLAAAGVKFPVTFDTVYYHAWPVEDTDQVTCNCKLITRDLVEQYGGTWLLLHENINIIDSETLQENKSYNLSHLKLDMKNEAVIDSFVHKKTAIITAIESCINILSVGLIVYKK